MRTKVCNKINTQRSALFRIWSLAAKSTSYKDNCCVVSASTENTSAQLHTILREEFKKCFNKLKTRWNKCIECQMDYFNEN